MKKLFNIEPHIWLILFLPLLIIGATLVKTTYFKNPICPNNFENIEKRTAEFQKWIDVFYRKNPSASTKETIEFRRDFLAKNNCEEALKTHDFYININGKIAEELTEAEGAIRENLVNPICPDDFKDPEQEVAAFDEWAKDFMYKNPTATIKEFSKARRDFYLENNCKEALKRYDDYMAGNVDEETKQLIESVIKEQMGSN